MSAARTQRSPDDRYKWIALSNTTLAVLLVVFRIVQGVGGACLLANAAAIITDAFPADQGGMALGINNIVGVSGLFVGLVLVMVAVTYGIRPYGGSPTGWGSPRVIAAPAAA